MKPLLILTAQKGGRYYAFRQLTSIVKIESSDGFETSRIYHFPFHEDALEQARSILTMALRELYDELTSEVRAKGEITAGCELWVDKGGNERWVVSPSSLSSSSLSSLWDFIEATFVNYEVMLQEEKENGR